MSARAFFAVVAASPGLAIAGALRADSSSVYLMAGYASRWTAWNHIRVASALLAALSFAITLR